MDLEGRQAYENMKTGNWEKLMQDAGYRVRKKEDNKTKNK